MPRGTFLDYCCHCPCPWGEPLPTHASIGDPPALAGSLVQSSVGSVLLSSASWCA